MSGKIPVILVTGFLGSGKTTLLHRMAENHPEWRMIFLVNEFADTSIDELKLDTSGTPTQSVVGGSLFCECKAGEFVRVMKEQVLAQHKETPLDAIIIETSGIADPEAIGDLMSLHGLSEDFEVRRIVCVVAAKRFLTLLKNLPSVGAQIRTSDLIVINKTDLSDDKNTAEVEVAIREANADAEILKAQHCDIAFDLGDTIRDDLPSHPLFSCDANPFSTETVIWPEAASIADAKTWLESLPDTILRIKGCISTPDGHWQVERTVDTLEILPLDEKQTNKLILIAHDDNEADLKYAAKSLTEKCPYPTLQFSPVTSSAKS